MILETFSYDREGKKWSVRALPVLDSERTLVLVFGATELIDDPAPIRELRRAYPRAHLIGCSSAGEIAGTSVRDNSLSVAVARFDKTPLASTAVEVTNMADSFAAGQQLARKLQRPDLRGVLVLSEGLGVNGSELVRGLNSVLPDTVVVTGGLSGDGPRFKRTWVCTGDKIKSGIIAAVGFYGDHVLITHGSKGGWDKFGPERVVTKSEANVLYELDGKPALALYKEYLGDKAADLPASGLLFPLAMRSSARDDKVLVRTLLAVDHEKNSMTFAGDIPKGYLVQLMKADFERLIGGAELAAQTANDAALGKTDAHLAVAISCVGRRLVLGQRTEEEVEAVLDVLPKDTKITGFYSYGEISPYATGHCDLHNQTMTLTVFSESPTPLAKKANGAPAAAKPAAAPVKAPAPAAGRAAETRASMADGMGEIEEVDWSSDTNVRAAVANGPGMRVRRVSYDLKAKRWSEALPSGLDSERTLVLVFGATELIDDPAPLKELRRAFPKAHLVGCSSAGEIAGTAVRDNSLSVAVMRFEKTSLITTQVEVSNMADSLAAGQQLARKLQRPDLRGVLVLSEGLGVNGSQLVRGLNSVLPETIVVTGGLSGDGARFKRTWVCVGDKIKSGLIAAVGFYGDHVLITHGSKGGWDKFGPERVVTKSEANVLYELDGKPALALYKEYLGDKAADLPASGLLFPLAMRSSAKDDKVLVRTLLAVDHEKNSMTFAGDIPKGYLVQLMKADFERLIGGAELAAQAANDAALGKTDAHLAVAISCVGRRLVLGQRTEEEVEAVLDVLPAGTEITGFYSYGEISPYATGHCDLHNQTMTLTVFSESPTPLAKKTNGAVSASTAPTALKPAKPGAGIAQLASMGAGPASTPTVTKVPSYSGTAGMRLDVLTCDLKTKKWSAPFPALDSERTLVLVFGATELIDDPAPLKELRRAFPKAHLIGCSSAGEIAGTSVRDGSLSVAVTRFEKTPLASAVFEVSNMADSFAAGQELARRLQRPDLRGVLVLSEGLGVNGSQLVRGLNSVLPDTVVVTGGLSGDGPRFKRTWVCAGDAIKSGIIAAVGFYGDHVLITHGSKGGWDKFGPERVVTKSEANVLYELDGKPALALYKEYLGDKAADLPASGLLFPLAMRSSTKDDKVLVRTLLAVDHEKNSMTFAGDIPKGYLVQLMKADFERLIGGAELAAQTANDAALGKTDAHLAVAISCVGRRLVLGQRTEEEVEAVLDVLPRDTKITGFYSYGEISPYATGHCDLHNQTMTLTVFSESPTPLAKKANGAPAAAKPAAAAETPAPAAVRAATPAAAAAPPTPRSDVLPSAPTPDSSSYPKTPSSVSVTSPSVDQRAAPTRSVAPTGLDSRAAGLMFDKRKVGDYLVVRIAGRMTETFKGAALAKELDGQVVFDLAGVERITSFGVREWLQLLSALEGRVKKLFLARCAEPVVTQVSMIRKFAGNGQILSFYAPYTCESCSNQFERLVDCELDADALGHGKAPAATCPRCNGPGSFDDDAQTYFGFVSQHGARSVSRELREVLEDLERAAEPVGGEAIEKIIDGRVTRVKVSCRLDTQVRWNRIVDGLEGQVVFDLAGVPSATPDGAARLEGALRSLEPSVESMRIEGCPKLLAERLAAPSAQARVAIVSAVVEGRCSSCSALRPVVVDVQENAEALREGRDPAVPCKRCNTPLAFDGSRALLHLLGAHAARLSQPAARPAPEPEVAVAAPARAEEPSLAAPAPSLAPPAPAAPAPRSGSMWLPALGLGLALAGGFMLWRSQERQQQPQPPPPAAAAAPAPSGGAAQPPLGWAKVDDLPPPWVERPFVIEGETIFVVGRSGPAANEEAALSMARSDAVERLASSMLPELVGSPIHDFVRSRAAADRKPENVEPVARRFLKQVGAFATPERVDAVMKQQAGGVEAIARYKLSKESYQQALSSYRAKASFAGLVVARFFPQLEASIRTQGELVIVDVQKNWQTARADVRPGDVVLEINKRPVSTVEAFEKVVGEEWASTPPNGTLTIRVESLGAQREVELRKPATQNEQPTYGQ